MPEAARAWLAGFVDMEQRKQSVRLWRLQGPVCGTPPPICATIPVLPMVPMLPGPADSAAMTPADAAVVP